MKTVKISSAFPASKRDIFKRLQRLKTLQYIAYPYATFAPVNGNNNLIWKSDEKFSFFFKLFGIIPFGVHNINVIKFDIDKGIQEDLDMEICTNVEPQNYFGKA